MIGSFIDGPLWYFSLAVFLLGSTWKLAAIIARGRPKSLAKPHYTKGGGAIATIFRRFVPYREFRAETRVQFWAGYAFHLGLLALLFFAAPHVEFISERITGFAWPAMPHWAFILAAELALGGLLFLILYRLMDPVTRYLSGRGDWISSWLVFLVMLTGCFALWRSHESLRLVHLFLAELMLLWFPFSSLLHALSFPLSRGFTGAIYHRKGVNI
jgi:nitrate reductase gamma subunit